MATPLVTPAVFKTYVPSASCDGAQLDTALWAATKAAERYTGRSFWSEETTEYYDGNGSNELPLNRWPITEVDSVYVDVNGMRGQVAGAFDSSTLLAAGNYFYTDRGSLILTVMNVGWPAWGWGGSYSPTTWPGLTRYGVSVPAWPRVPGCVKVTYTAGYAQIPQDLQAAVVAMAQFMIETIPDGGLVQTSTSYIDVSTGSGFITEALARGNVPALGSSRAILDSYRDFKLGRNSP